MTAPLQRLDVTVEELVLRGVPPDQVHAVVAAFEERLVALATEHARSASTLAGRTLHAVRARPSRSAATTPQALGAQAAVSVWTTVTGTGEGEVRDE